MDDDKQWRPQAFEIRLWDQPVIRFDFQAVKILDYQGREAELAADPNPFAAVVLAQLTALKTKHDPQRRFEMKWHLTRQLYEKQFTKQEIQHLYLFIDWVRREVTSMNVVIYEIKVNRDLLFRQQ